MITPEEQTKIERNCEQIKEFTRQLDILAMDKTAFASRQEVLFECRRLLLTTQMIGFLNKLMEKSQPTS